MHMHAFVAATAGLLVLPISLAAQTANSTFLSDEVLSALEARSIGPANFGGRIVDIEADPSDPATFYIAYGTGGLWKTVNAGTTFQPVFDDQPVFSIGDVALAPSDPSVLYVGTGEANNQRSSYWGNGVYKTTDGGKKWQHIGLDGTDHIGRIVIHPTDPNTAWVAALGALYSPNEERGIYKTTDGGKSWDKTGYVNEDVGFVDIALHPSDPQTLYAASYERRRRAWDFDEAGPGSGIYKSLDGGDTWARIEQDLPRGEIGRIGLAVSPQNPKTVFAIVENRNPAPRERKRRNQLQENTDGNAGKPLAPEGRASSETKDPDIAKRPDDPEGLYPFAYNKSGARPAVDDEPRRRRIGGEVYRSDDAGATWAKLNEKPVGGSPHYYYGQIRVDPTDDNTLYVVGVQVYSTTDNGKTWRADFANGVHVDHHAIWIDPSDPAHILLGNDGGLCITHDRGKHWDYVNDLPVGQFYAVGVDNRVPYTVYGGTQDNGTWAIPSRSTTTRPLQRQHAFKVGGGDGFYAVIDATAPDIVYGEYQFGGLYRRDLATGKRASIRPKAPKGSPDLRFNWMSPLIASPHDPQTLYYGSQYLHKSTDRGSHWKTVSADLTRNDLMRQRGDVPHCTITTITESPLHQGLLYVGTDDGKVQRTSDGGSHWYDLSDRFPDLPPDTPLWVSRVEASCSDKNTIYVSFTGYREDIRTPFLYLSTDRGESFRRLGNGQLPDGGINVVREHPRNPRVLFVGHEFGVAISIDGGGTWVAMPQLPTIPVHDLLIHPSESDLVVATHGRGFYIVDVTPLETFDGEAAQREFVAFAPRSVQLRQRGFPHIGNPGQRGWSADQAPTRPSFYYYLREDVDEAVTVEVLNAAGTVLYSRQGPRAAGLHRLSWVAPRRRGRRSRNNASRAAPGYYAARFRWGNTEEVFPFRVVPPHGMAPSSQLAETLLLEFEQGVTNEEAAEATNTSNAGRDI